MVKSLRQEVIKKFDRIFSIRIRLRDSYRKDGKRWIKCPLCGSIVPRKKAENMHFVKRYILKRRFSEQNCHAGCHRCNVVLNGNYEVYKKFMIEQY
ncbi:recombination protein NinG [bacterium]|nr:recombination protein NinG [bacterium]